MSLSNHEWDDDGDDQERAEAYDWTPPETEHARWERENKPPLDIDLNEPRVPQQRYDYY